MTKPIRRSPVLHRLSDGEHRRLQILADLFKISKSAMIARLIMSSYRTAFGDQDPAELRPEIDHPDQVGTINGETWTRGNG